MSDLSLVMPDGRTALHCSACGAGGVVAPHVSEVTCWLCRGVTGFRQCGNCSAIVLLTPEAMDPAVKSWVCFTCGKTARRGRWGLAHARDITVALPEYAAVYAKLGLTPIEALSDPDKRTVHGSILSASGMSGIATGGCSIFFCRTGAALMIGDVTQPTAILYEDMRALRLTGRGTLIHTSGGNWMGGGFGLAGALEGALIAGALNSLTTRTQTSLETIISFAWRQSEIVLLNTTYLPATLATFLAPAVTRMETAHAADRTSIAGGATGDVVSRLKELGELHAAGILSADEFAAAKARVLAD